MAGDLVAALVATGLSQEQARLLIEWDGSIHESCDVKRGEVHFVRPVVRDANPDWWQPGERPYAIVPRDSYDVLETARREWHAAVDLEVLGVPDPDGLTFSEWVSK